jgi:hypothetical protein
LWHASHASIGPYSQVAMLCTAPPRAQGLGGRLWVRTTCGGGPRGAACSLLGTRARQRPPKTGWPSPTNGIGWRKPSRLGARSGSGSRRSRGSRGGLAPAAGDEPANLREREAANSFPSTPEGKARGAASAIPRSARGFLTRPRAKQKIQSILIPSNRDALYRMIPKSVRGFRIRSCAKTKM